MNKYLAIALLASLAGIASAVPDHASTIRPPAYPLAVRNPYLNVWLNRNELPGNWPVFWTQRPKGWTGLIRVDGETYVYMGNPSDEGKPFGPRATQTGTFVTPTQSIFEIRAGPVDLTVNFFSPVETDDIMRQSIPLSYVTLDVKSNDGASHEVQAYMDISGEWASNEDSQIVTWKLNKTPQGLQFWQTEPQVPRKFGETADYAAWGQAVLASSGAATSKSGEDLVVRRQFVAQGSLDNTDDTNYRCVSCRWPVVGFAENLGQVSDAVKSVQYVVGHVREDAANWLGEEQKALWFYYWPTQGELIDFFWFDVETSRKTADALDVKILNDAFNSAGQAYADILAFSLRQSFAGNEFAGTSKDHPIYYQKEISSGAFMQTVDVIYPTSPMWYYLNVTYLELLMEPLFGQMENSVWTKPFALHDIGDFYPNALGQGYGGDMPVEESSNMLMMVGNVVFHPTANLEKSKAYVRKHFEVMGQWADYLLRNCLYPTNQLTTDDFIGPTELNSGLALKGILAMKTFAKLAELIEEDSVAKFYNDVVAEYVPIWMKESMHVDGDHFKMEYNVTNGYQFKYNAFHDKLFKLNVVPDEVYEMEAKYYLSKLEPYGIPFVSTHDYTKSDWEMWTAAAFGEYNPELRSSLVNNLGQYLKYTASRVPFSDWYVTATANMVGFVSRPVVGGHFALLALERSQGKI